MNSPSQKASNSESVLMTWRDQLLHINRISFTIEKIVCINALLTLNIFSNTHSNDVDNNLSFFFRISEQMCSGINTLCYRNGPICDLKSIIMVQKRLESIVLMELRLFCITASKYGAIAGAILASHFPNINSWRQICQRSKACQLLIIHGRADSRFAPSQWETLFQNYAVFHWIGTCMALMR